MEAKNLRIGNFIASGSNPKNIETWVIGKVHSISSMDSEFEQIEIETEEGFTWFFKDNYFGIPLTEKWLIDLGFRKDEETNYRWFMEDWLAYDLDDNCIRISDSWEFGKRKYVHELQNLFFAITGRELELK